MVSPVPRQRLAKQVPNEYLLAAWRALSASLAQSVPLKGPPYMRHRSAFPGRSARVT